MSSDVKIIRLYGALGKEFGRVHKFAVNSPAEAVRALCAMVPGIQQYFMHAKDKGMEFAVYAGKRNLTLDEVRYPSGQDEIKFVPVIQGGKNGGAIMTIVGAVLVVVGIFLIWTPFGAPLIGVGLALMAAGIIVMLSPQAKPEDGDKPDNRPSYSFNGPVNTEAQGNPVPVAYGGPMYVGSAVISASLEAKDDSYAPNPATTGSSGYGGGGGKFTYVNTNTLMS